MLSEEELQEYAKNPEYFTVIYRDGVTKKLLGYEIRGKRK